MRVLLTCESLKLQSIGPSLLVGLADDFVNLEAPTFSLSDPNLDADCSPDRA